MRKIGWVVDCQNDFMHPSGALYVKHLNDPDDEGSAKIIPALQKTVRWMHDHCDIVFFTGDWHTRDDEEISDTPDFVSTFPPHCMAETFGAEIIPEFGVFLPLAVGPEYDPFLEVMKHVQNWKYPSLLILKNKFDVFAGNENIDAVLKMFTTPGAEVFICGVATDVCVKMAVEGFLHRGYNVSVFSNSVYGLGLIPDEELFSKWRSLGATLL